MEWDPRCGSSVAGQQDQIANQRQGLTHWWGTVVLNFGIRCRLGLEDFGQDYGQPSEVDVDHGSYA
jgi:hypothetical protein